MSGQAWAIGALLSGLAHVWAIDYVASRPPRSPEPPRPIAHVILPEPAPAPVPEPDIAPASTPEPVPRPRPLRRTRPRPATPPPAEQVDVVPPPAVGVSLDQTVPGGLAMATGVTLDGVLGTGAGDVPAPPPAPAVPGPKSGRSGTTLVPVYEVSQLPQMTRQVAPEVPESLRARGGEATVVIEVTIDARGHASDPEVVTSAGPELDAAALAALKASRFAPARVDDRPVAVRYRVPYRFRIRG